MSKMDPRFSACRNKVRTLPNQRLFQWAPNWLINYPSLSTWHIANTPELCQLPNSKVKALHPDPLFCCSSPTWTFNLNSSGCPYELSPEHDTSIPHSRSLPMLGAHCPLPCLSFASKSFHRTPLPNCLRSQNSFTSLKTGIIHCWTTQWHLTKLFYWSFCLPFFPFLPSLLNFFPSFFPSFHFSFSSFVF